MWIVTVEDLNTIRDKQISEILEIRLESSERYVKRVESGFISTSIFREAKIWKSKEDCMEFIENVEFYRIYSSVRKSDVAFFSTYSRLLDKKLDIKYVDCNS